MKTRFDYADAWVTAMGEQIPITDMETNHLINTVKMLLQKPDRVLSILITDIESGAFNTDIWTAHCTSDSNTRACSINNATSMSAKELVDYVQTTPLFTAMVKELESRGVNVENTVNVFCDLSGHRVL